LTLYSDSIVDIRGLRKRFGSVQALDGLSLKVCRGDVFGFLGPNGSGKSTTIRIMVSLVKADEGEVRLLGQSADRSNPTLLSRVGALIERPSFYEHLSAGKNLSVLLKYSGREPDKETIVNTLMLTGLQERQNDKVRTYSEGMKQRLGIAQAIIHEPELLILDEPFSNLDPEGIRDIRDLILKLNREKGMTIIISSHKLDEIEKLVSRLVLIRKGKTLAKGSVNQLVNQGAITTRLVTNNQLGAMASLKDSTLDIQNLTIKENTIFFSCTRSIIPEVNTHLVSKGFKVESISPDLSLESFFLSIINKG
jgi:ABC-type multidrug transport system ATPase subunit